MSATERKALIEKIENARDSRVLLYVTGDRQGQETILHSEVFDHFVDHLDAIGVTKRISLVLYTRGGDGMAAWQLLNLLRMFCDDLEVIVPVKAHSAGTMMAIGADRIVMTKQATISPIDPSLNHALAPQIQGAPVGARATVSVEAINGYLSLAKDTLGNSKQSMSDILLDLSRQVHPLVLGETYRRRQQTQSMAERLLAPHIKNAANRKKIITFLSSDSGSHDYTLNRREATALGLDVVKCPATLYPILRDLYHDFRDEMLFRTPFNASQFPANAVTPFKNLRATVESSAAAPVQFITEGTFSKQPAPPPGVGEIASVEVTSEGWRTI